LGFALDDAPRFLVRIHKLSAEIELPLSLSNHPKTLQNWVFFILVNFLSVAKHFFFAFFFFDLSFLWPPFGKVERR